MTSTTRPPATMTLTAVKRRQRATDPDPVQVRLDRDYLVGLVERQDEEIVALRAALLEQGQLAEEAGLVLRGVYQVARQIAQDKTLEDGS